MVAQNPIDLARAVVEVLESRRRGALATVVRTSGSTPQQPGARLLLRPDGIALGTVGGGAIEHAVLDELRAAIRDGRPRLVVRDLGYELGMCCGGRMEVFVEPIEAVQRLILLGAGHVACATAAAARGVGFAVTVVDDREDLCTEARFPGCARILAEPAAAVSMLAPTEHDWLFVVTHDHRLDEEAFDVFVRLPHRYLGMIGSRRKVLRILGRVHAKSPLPSLERVYAPVGLDVGAVTPEEIAVSVVAELVALRHGRPAPHLRLMQDPRLARVLSGEIGADAAARVESEDVAERVQGEPWPKPI